jgi:hypothetical protein
VQPVGPASAEPVELSQTVAPVVLVVLERVHPVVPVHPGVPVEPARAVEPARPGVPVERVLPAVRPEPQVPAARVAAPPSPTTVR